MKTCYTLFAGGIGGRLRDSYKRMKAATFFCGAGGACAGLEQAGLEVIWGNEYCPPIAAIWKANHPNAVLDGRDIFDLPIEEIPEADLYWFSPPCPEFSLAKPGRTGGTSKESTWIAQKIARIITAKRPSFVVIENVEGYANSHSLPIILRALEAIGHQHTQQVLNAADYGAPQSRRRLIVRSAKKLADLPKTHSRSHHEQLPLFGDRLLPWVGWHEAISDLIPSLKPTKLSAPQLAELDRRGLLRRASVTLIDGQANNYGKSVTVRDQSEPAPTVLANTGTRQVSRIVLVQLTGYHDRSPAVLPPEQPVWTITASQACDGKVNKNGHPSYRPPATIATGLEILRVDRRCLARFQGFPDSHIWSNFEGLNARVIGNAVPVQLAAAIGRSMQNCF